MRVFFLINQGRRTAPVPPARMDAFRAAFDAAGVEAEIVPCHGADRVPALVERARAEGEGGRVRSDVGNPGAGAPVAARIAAAPRNSVLRSKRTIVISAGS